jgi:murein L,D-transpeptidase YcbB/YkuD
MAVHNEHVKRNLHFPARPTARFGRPVALQALIVLLLACPVAAQVPPAQPQPVMPQAITPAQRLAAIDTVTLGPAARLAVAASLERWQALGPLPQGRWLLVNIPAYEIRLYEGPAEQARWRAIVGKPKTPTPTFKGTANGVILNPWWDVPASIVAESVGRLMARNPRRAAAQGYVREGQRYRQAPGPDNQLGRMKLDFRNAHSVGIHDTPSRHLFQRERRALSHGCIRVDDALGFAATLLGPPVSRDSLKAVIDASRETRTLAFPQAIPVIVAYFTAEVAPDGTLVVHEDVYRKDSTAMAGITRECGP